MVVFGVVWIIICSRLKEREPVRVYENQEQRENTDEEKARERNRRRATRKKLK
jgi:hypothetical protein